MDNLLQDALARMQALQESQDSTLNGGFVSVTGGRYRVVVNDNQPPNDPNNGPMGLIKLQNANCTGSNTGCDNMNCKGSHNISSPPPAGFTDCVNGYCYIHSNSDNSYFNK